MEVGDSGSQTNDNPPNAFLFGQSELNREDVFVIFESLEPLLYSRDANPRYISKFEFHKYLRFFTLGLSIEFLARINRPCHQTNENFGSLFGI